MYRKWVGCSPLAGVDGSDRKANSEPAERQHEREDAQHEPKVHAAKG